MTAVVVVIAVAAGAVASLVAAQLHEHRAHGVVAKAAASAGFVIVALLRADLSVPYDRWVLAALVLCLAGDLLLALPRGFPLGLGSFLCGHVAYVLAFSVRLPLRAWPVALVLPPLVVSAAVALWLAPHLGRLRAPVLVYVAVITVMVWGAVAVTTAGRGPWIVTAGAVLFYLSDFAVARDRLVTRTFASRVWGLPAYYLGQFLLALTVGR
ncbi:MAG: lysoplasmalogenase [Acidobacteriia bacterium]|nr:lysoplasmalogenase [Terriglobia bacterium]